LKVSNGTGKIDEIQFHDVVGEAMNFDERQQFYQKYVKRLRLKKNQETTRIGMLSGMYKADWETFLSMMLPRGYKMPALPDPAKHCCSHDELVSYHFVTGQKGRRRRGQTPPVEDDQVRLQSPHTQWSLPQIERNDKAGKRLPRKVYTDPTRLVHETRSLKQHEAIVEEPLSPASLRAH
jgi:hypothetical protein